MLVNKLVTADYIYKVITLTRRSIIHSSTKIANHVVNFDRLEDVSSLFNANFLLSCLGTTSSQASSITAQCEVDLEYQYKAAQLAAQNRILHYLLISSRGANAKGHNPYLKMKGELEQRVQSLGFKCISIFQLSLLMGQRNEP